MPAFAALDRLKADLDILRPLAPEQEARILQKFRLDWNYHSNAIEGNALTLGETRSLLLHGLTAQGKPLRDHLDIRGHNDAVLWLEEIVRDDRPLTENFIREIHEVLLGEPYDTAAQTPDGQPTRKRIVPGRYKTQPNNVLTATGETFYFASPEETPARMTALVDAYRAELAAPTLHPIELAARFHYDFVRIHPFDDGNGRMSRLLMNLILLRHGYPMTVIKNDDRNRYLAALADADAGDFTPFLAFIADNVEASLQLMLRGARGESIEDADDLDKELALLKIGLATRIEFGKTTWNPTTQGHWYEQIFAGWLTDFWKEMARFEELFRATSIGLNGRSESRNGFSGGIKAFSALSEVLAVASGAFHAEDVLITEITFSVDWDDFLKPGALFSQSAFLKFKFDPAQYEVEFATYERKKNTSGYSPKIVFASNYIVPPDKQQVHEINHQLAAQVLAFIKAKLVTIAT